jgi:hypothetical protein
MKNDLVAAWRKPDNSFRAAPFWAWNGKLEEPELRRQIKFFKAMGLGGFFMHARVGLDTPYLSEEWFKMVNACIDEAKKHGLDAWLYDEDRWPSGAAGGMVTKHPEFRSKLIYLHEIPGKNVKDYVLPDDVIRVFAAEVDGIKAKKVRQVPLCDYKKIKSSETLLVFQLAYAANSDWYNGYCYLDTMNKAAVKKFIDVTHEAYRRNCGKEFGKTVPGIFGDEPQLGFITTYPEWMNNGKKEYSTPYNEQIAKIIKKQYKYDFFDHLVEIFFDLDEVKFSRVRVDYISVMSDLFIEAYAKQLGEWCGKNMLSYTGHVMGEDSLAIQTWTTGSAMRFYEHMQIPGIDQLTERQRCFAAAKQVSSAANQFGQVRRITETYGCTGWDFPLLGHKALGDWQYALGINFRCQHLAHFSMAAEAKRDYPASISYQSPWAKEYSLIENYFARLGAVLTRGVEVQNILLITPIESAWSFIRKDFQAQADTKAFDEKFLAIQDYLMKNSLDFDFGDEDIISRTASIEKKLFRVNKAVYQAVIIPDMLTMRESTLKLLNKFAMNGGLIIQAGQAAEYVNCIPDPRPRLLAKLCKKQLSALEKVRNISFTAKLKRTDSIIHLIKRDDTADYIFAVNLGHQLDCRFGEDPLMVPRVVDRTLALPQVVIQYTTSRLGNVYELDAVTGKIFTADAVKTASGYTITSSFPALTSRLFIVTTDKLPVSRPAVPLNTKTLKLPEQWQVKLSGCNVMVLDHFAYKTGKTNWSSKSSFVMQLDDMLKTQIKLPQRGGMMVQPWVSKPAIGQQLNLQLRAKFNCEALPDSDLFLALEAAEKYQIKINQTVIKSKVSGYFIDRSCSKIKINKSLLRQGENTIELSCIYDAAHKGLEAVFLLGDFGVTLEQDGISGRMTPPVRKLNNGNWVSQGLAFYPGSVDYITKINRKTNHGVNLNLPEWRGSLIKVLIDNRPVKTFITPPYELDLSKYIAGKTAFELKIRVFGSPRNSHGPFFNTEKFPRWCGPGEFKDYKHPQRHLVECGLL